MAATNYLCLKTFTDDARCVQALPGMVVAFDPVVKPDVVASHLANGVMVLNTDITNTHPIMVTREKLKTP